MRIWDIAFAMILFNAMAGLMYALLGSIIPGAFGAVALVDVTSTVKQLSDSLNVASSQGVSIQAVFSWFNVTFQLLLMMLSVIFTLIVSVVAGTLIILLNVGVPIMIALSIQGIVWVVELIGLWQVLAGRSFREYE